MKKCREYIIEEAKQQVAEKYGFGTFSDFWWLTYDYNKRQKALIEVDLIVSGFAHFGDQAESKPQSTPHFNV